MPEGYNPAWLMPVCVVVAALVLAIDLGIKSAIVAESMKLRKALEDEKRQGPGNGGHRIDASDTGNRGSDVLG